MVVNLYDRVYTTVKKIPKGRVATYGQIAALCGSPRAAQQVGWALHALDTSRGIHGVPWQRVINREGRISTTCLEHGPQEQAALLMRDGVDVTRRGSTFWVDLTRYLWRPMT